MNDHQEQKLVLGHIGFGPVPPPANPMIAEALKQGADTGGLCTVRAVAAMILEDEKGQPIEMYFMHEGVRVNVLISVIAVDGRPIP